MCVTVTQLLMISTIPMGASENGDEGVVEFLGRRVFDNLLVDLDLLLEGAEENDCYQLEASGRECGTR